MVGFNVPIIFLCGMLVLVLLSLVLYREYAEIGTIDVFNPLYSLTGFWFFLFIIRPIYVLLRGSDINPYTTTLPDLAAFPLAIIVGTIGWLALFVGYTRSQGLQLEVESKRKIRLSAAVYFYSAVLFSIIGLAAVYVMMQTIYDSYGLYEVLFGNTLEILYETRASGRFLFEYLREYVLLGFFLALGGAVKYEHRGCYALSVVLFPLSLFVTLMSGYRWNFVKLFGVPLILLHYSNSRFRIRLHHVALLLPVFLVILSGLNAVRANITFSEFRFLGALTALRPFDDFVILIHSLNIGQIHHQWGRQYLWRFSGVAFIPRILWEGKPVISSAFIYTKTVYGPLEQSTHTLTIIGELYYQLHLFGVIGGMYIFGRFWRYLYAGLEDYRHIPLFIILYAYTLLLGINTFRSSLGSFGINFVITVVPLLLPLVFAYCQVTAVFSEGRNRI